MDCRLRIYTLYNETADDFIRRWATELVPLREAMGFQVLGAWRVLSEHQLVWIVGWPGPGSYDDAEARYHDSPARRAVTWDTADFVASYDVRPVDPVSWQS